MTLSDILFSLRSSDRSEEATFLDKQSQRDSSTDSIVIMMENVTTDLSFQVGNDDHERTLSLIAECMGLKIERSSPQVLTVRK